ncbi:MAG: LysR family transcriptional regulator [Proteobacteria bacterium]|nr:LysR family transcriptional regulator [Pseudomonadota bacterium]
MTSTVGWELYRSFLGVLDEGSLSGASRALDITQPTVGRHVGALETALEVVLFTRSQTGFLPTEAARSLEPHARAMAVAAAALERAAQGQGAGIVGTVRVTASEMLGVEVLPPILARLQDEHPGLRIELSLSDRVQNLLARESDIAVRGFRPDQEQLVVQRVGEVQLGLHASKEYLARHGTPKTVADLRPHRLVGFDADTPYLRQARKDFPMWRREAFAVRCDSDCAQLSMLRAGGGIGICQVPLARSHGLRRVLPEVNVPLPMWLAMHEDLRSSPRCRATYEALAVGLRKYCGRD